MLENRKLNDIKTDIQSDKEYKYLLSEIDSEIAELTDEDVNNDGFELDWCLTEWFAHYLWKEKAQQWLESIKNVYSDDCEEIPEWVQEFVDFLESIEESPSNEAPAEVQDSDVDFSKKYGYALDGSEYNSDNSFTSKSGITYKLYDQTEGSWSLSQENEEQVKEYKYMKNRWCMLTAAAVVASSLWNFNLTPWDFYKNFKHKLVSSSVPLASDGKLKADKINNLKSVKDKIVKGLQEWNPAIIMAFGQNKWGASKFTNGQHYMALLDISEDWSKIFVWNSHTADNWSYSSNWWYPTSEVLTSVKEATIFSKNV